MPTFINSTSTGLIITPDATGALTLQANGVTALTANTTGYLNFAKQPTIGGGEWPAYLHNGRFRCTNYETDFHKVAVLRLIPSLVGILRYLTSHLTNS